MANPQFKFRRTKTARNIGGIRGLAVRVDGAQEAIQALATLPVRVQRRVVRLAMAAAARPVVQAMKAGARAASKKSKRGEGIGTTARAIVSKVATSKKDPSIAYAVVGARRGYAEFVTLHSDWDRRAGVAHIQTQRRIRRKGKNVIRRRDLKHIGPIARKARLDPKSNSTRKRVASRYLHLFEKRGTRRPAPRFMDAAARSSASAAVTAFNRVFMNGLVREFHRMAAK